MDTLLLKIFQSKKRENAKKGNIIQSLPVKGIIKFWYPLTIVE